MSPNTHIISTRFAIAPQQRTARVNNPTMTVTTIDKDDDEEDIATFTQKHMSDDYRGPGVDQLRAALQRFKQDNDS